MDKEFTHYFEKYYFLNSKYIVIELKVKEYVVKGTEVTKEANLADELGRFVFICNTQVFLLCRFP